MDCRFRCGVTELNWWAPFYFYGLIRLHELPTCQIEQDSLANISLYPTYVERFEVDK